MRPSRRFLGSFFLAPVLSLALASGALATDITYAMSGFEVAATATVGTFIGAASSIGDAGLWKASIEHTPLSDGAPTITGGTFAYHGKIRDIAGTFNAGGSLSQRPSAPGRCPNQTYDVSGSLTLTVPSGATGHFTAVLTHYRIWLGRCIVYAATVKGTFNF